MTANKLPKVKLERTNDRLGAITFDTWGKISVKDKNKKEMEVKYKFYVSCINFPFQFEKLMSDKRRPFGVLIGTFEKFIHSKVSDKE